MGLRILTPVGETRAIIILQFVHSTLEGMGVDYIINCPSWLFCCSVHSSRTVMSNSLQPMDCSTPVLPVHHQLPEPAQTHVHLVSDAIQPSHPLLSPSSPAFNLSQHRYFAMSQFFTSGGQVFELQHQSMQ